MTSMQESHIRGLSSFTPVLAGQDLLRSGGSTNVRIETEARPASPALGPVRASFPGRKTPDGGGLSSIRTLKAVSFPSGLVSDKTIYDTKTSPRACAEELLESDKPRNLPAKKGSRFYRWLRWGFGSVYRRIFALAYASNLAVLTVLAIYKGLGLADTLTYDSASTAVSANILASLLVRNEHVINALFIAFGSWPKGAPLRLRRLFAKIYSYGGVHSGCGVSATFWYTAYLVLVTRDFTAANVTLLRGYILLVSYTLIVLLVMILGFAHPRVRVHLHNWFEAVHRFLGWLVVLLFWTQTLMLATEAASKQQVPMATAVRMSSSFWMLVLVTLLVIYPWAHLRLRDVEAEVLSDHVVKLSFNYANVNYGQAVRLSDAPLKETHAFAVIPSSQPAASESSRPYSSTNPVTKNGFSVLVSDAGDWTKKIIQSPPKRIWTRGVPQYGVLRVAGLFKPVIIIATGSGIGPCLSLFVQAPEHPVRIIWSTPRPKETYGQAVIDTILSADPQAVIIDTRKEGRPDLVALAYRMYESSRFEESRRFMLDGTRENVSTGHQKPVGPCEACVIISNQRVTKKVVYGLESRNVPAYGAIFDS